jgi:Predicted membrane protein
MGLRPSVNTDMARLLLLSLVVLAFALRLYQLDYQSLWRDELDAIRFARRDLSGLLPLFVKPGHNGPLYYTILHFWIRLAGDSEFSARFFSLACGVLAVPLIFRLGQWWMERGGSLLAATLCATSPYLIWYSQEAKMYALLFLLSILSTHVYLLALDRNRIYLWLSYLLTIIIGMYVHLLAVLIIPFHFLLFLVTWPRYREALRPWLIAFALLALPYLPLARWEVPLLISPFTTGHHFYSFSGRKRMRRLRHVRMFLRADIKAASSLIPWIVLSLLIVFTLARSDVTLAYPAFQSPVGTPTTESPLPATAAPTGFPGSPSPEAPLDATPEASAEPTPEVPGEVSPEGSVEPQDTPAEAEPSQEPVATPENEDEPSAPPSSRPATFIDTCVLGLSYVWLCCGGMVLLLFVLGAAFSFLLRRA